MIRGPLPLPAAAMPRVEAGAPKQRITDHRQRTEVLVVRPQGIRVWRPNIGNSAQGWCGRREARCSSIFYPALIGVSCLPLKC
jgi:hypothetical protein